MSNFIVTADDLNNDFNFSASFSDYLQGSSNTTYFTGTAMNGASAAADEFSQSHIFNLSTDTAASYDIGDQINFSAVINGVQETMSYTVTADDIEADAATTAETIATNIATDLNPSSFTIARYSGYGKLTISEL